MNATTKNANTIAHILKLMVNGIIQTEVLPQLSAHVLKKDFVPMSTLLLNVKL